MTQFDIKAMTKKHKQGTIWINKKTESYDYCENVKDLIFCGQL